MRTPKLEQYKSKGRFSWRLKAGNGRIICTPERMFGTYSESIWNMTDSRSAFKKKRLSGLRFFSTGKQRRWRMVDNDGFKLCGPHESFVSKAGAKRNAATVAAAFKRAKKEGGRA